MLKLSNNKVDNLIKEKINYIYKFLNLKDYNYDILKTDDQLPLIDIATHISINFAGTRCFLIFNKINNKYYSYLINRRDLSYNAVSDYSKVELININITLNDTIYNGTIFDGIYIKSKYQNTFVITDMFYLEGVPKNTLTISSKLDELHNYMDKYYKKGNTVNTIEITINKLFDIADFDKVISTELPAITNYSKSGICFYPKYSGKKIIYLFDKINKNEPEHKPIEIESTRNPEILESNIKNDDINDIKKTIYEPMHNNVCIFEVKKNIEKPDVYYLYGIQEFEGKLIKQRIDTCYVQSITDSEKYREMFKKEDTLLARCMYLPNKNKWKILERINNANPSYISELNKKNITIKKNFLF
jgi:hypothetical protein